MSHDFINIWPIRSSLYIFDNVKGGEQDFLPSELFEDELSRVAPWLRKSKELIENLLSCSHPEVLHADETLTFSSFVSILLNVTC